MRSLEGDGFVALFYGACFAAFVSALRVFAVLLPSAFICG